MIIDTHSHLDGEEFAEDLDETIQRAKAAEIEKIFIPAINLAGMPHLIEVCKAYKGYLYPMIGLHPEEVREDYQDELDKLHELLKANQKAPKEERFIAIGEVGLDFYWDSTYRQQQLDAFEQQIQWAEEFNLPLMIHSRNAQAELVETMDKHRSSNLRGVFHCFNGTEEEAKQLLSFQGFMLGIGGTVTFKKNNLKNVLKETVPLDRIVVETDSPYLAPVPHRGKRNESALIIETIKLLAGIYECEMKNIAFQTKKNANFFIE